MQEFKLSNSHVRKYEISANLDVKFKTVRIVKNKLTGDNEVIIGYVRYPSKMWYECTICKKDDEFWIFNAKISENELLLTVAATILGDHNYVITCNFDDYIR